MELVYLWVENYKNIHHQGFNFSPRFHCEYNHETNDLTINENNNYIPDFFGKNINVTAIVGKNGSGKSSVLEFIKNFEKQKDNYCLVFKIDNENFVLYSGMNLQYDKNIVTELNIFLSYFSIFSYSSEFNQKNIIDKESVYQIITNLIKDDKNDIFEKFQHIFYPQKMEVSENSFYKQELLDELDKNIFDDLQNYNFPLTQKVENLINKNKDNSLIESIYEEINSDESKYEIFKDFLIDEKFIELGGLSNLQEHWKNADGTYPDEDDIKIIINDNYINILEENKWIKENISIKEVHQKLCEKILFILEKLFKKDSPEINILYIFLFNQIVEEELVNDYLNEIINSYLNQSNYKKDLLKKGIEWVEELFIKPCIIKIEIRKFSLKKLKYDLEEFEDCFKCFKIESLTNIQKDSLFNKYSKFLSFDFIDKRYGEIRYFSNLSYGEKTFYSQFLTIFYKIYNDKNKNHLLLFDEPDLSLHPEWQRQYIDELVNIVQKLDKDMKLHFLLTSHSPFLLSDIPKENIIFLDKYKKNEKNNQREGNCKVVDGLKQTFGANIHTLLSDSFFMEDGLMGEFAKSKIRTIKVAHRYILHKDEKKFLIKESYDKSKQLIIENLPKFWQTQEIIGEPFLQKIVKNQLEEIELVLLGRDEAIDKEIVRLQALKASSKNA